MMKNVKRHNDRKR